LTITLAATQPYEDFVAAFMALLPTEPVKTEAELQAEHDQTMVDRGIVAAESLAFCRANASTPVQTDAMREQLQRDHPPGPPIVVADHGDRWIVSRPALVAPNVTVSRTAPRPREAAPSRRAASRRTSRGSPKSDDGEPDPPLGGFPLCPECNERAVIPTGRVRRQRADAELCGSRCRKRRERRLKREAGHAAAWTDPLEEAAAFLRESALVADVERGRVSPWDALLRVVLPPAELREASRQLALKSEAA
jgi:hypothetical protein